MMKNNMVFSIDPEKDIVIGSNRYPREVSKETYVKECETFGRPIPPVEWLLPYEPMRRDGPSFSMAEPNKETPIQTPKAE